MNNVKFSIDFYCIRTRVSNWRRICVAQILVLVRGYKNDKVFGEWVLEEINDIYFSTGRGQLQATFTVHLWRVWGYV